MEALAALEEGSLICNGIDVNPEKITLTEFTTLWIAHVKAAGLEPRTWTYYEQKLGRYVIPKLGNLQLAKLRPLHLQTLYSGLIEAGKSPRTVVHVHEVIHNALGQAVTWKALPSNPADDARPPRPPAAAARVKFLTVEQGQRFWRHLQSSNHPLAVLYAAALLTGMREGELLGLRWADLDLEEASLRVSQTVWIPTKREADQIGHSVVFKPYPKSRKARVVSITPTLATMFRAHRAQQLKVREERLAAGALYANYDLVWAREDGRPLRPEYALDKLRRLLAAAGVPATLRFHELRHSTASLRLALGDSLKDIQDLLGHATMDITADLYTHLMPDTHRKSTLRLEALLLSGQSSKKKRPAR